MDRKPFAELHQQVHRGRNLSPLKSFGEEDSQDSGVFSPTKLSQSSSQASATKFARSSSSRSEVIKSTSSQLFSEPLEEEDEGGQFEVDVDDLMDSEDSPDPLSQVGGLSSLLFGEILCEDKDVSSSSERRREGAETNVSCLPAALGKSAIHGLMNMVEEGTSNRSKFESTKRPSPSSNVEYGKFKRVRSAFPLGPRRNGGSESDMEEDVENSDVENRMTKPMPRPQSESSLTIKNALEKIQSDEMLIGDASKRYMLPVVKEKRNKDLMEITGGTLVDLMRGGYNPNTRYQIIDCRYPFEYNHGHIQGAINLYSQKQIFDHFLANMVNGGGDGGRDGEAERTLLVFHCEFSSKRAPELCRYLRGADRNCNSDKYPALYFPELYLLKGGYKDFYQLHSEYCTPRFYLPMDKQEYSNECRFFKQKSKSELFPFKKSSKVPLQEINRQFPGDQNSPVCGGVVVGGFKSFKKLDLEL